MLIIFLGLVICYALIGYIITVIYVKYAKKLPTFEHASTIHMFWPIILIFGPIAWIIDYFTDKPDFYGKKLDHH